MGLSWIVIGIMTLAIIVLGGYILTIHASLRDIGDQLQEKIDGDTNTPIVISHWDSALKQLAAQLNVQLKALRKEQLRFQNGDREIKEAITNISHDLRTPLTAINGYLDLLENEVNNDNAERYIAIIRERANTLTEYTQELLQFSIVTDPGQALHPRKTSLNTVLEETLAAMYGAFTARGITPAVSMPEIPVVRDVDPAALGRVLNNILNNALKHSGGDLHIALTEDGVLTFSNSAPDLTPVEVERLFDRFYTVSSARNSTGLGLSIAKSLTQQMGGDIAASYHGGRFCLTLSFPGAFQK